MIHNLLIGKTPQEKARIKSQEIGKLAPIGKFSKDNIEVEIIGSIKEI